MSTVRILIFSFLLALVSIPLACSADPPEFAPSPPPEHGADVPSPASNVSPGTSPTASPSPSPSPSHSVNSPPAPPPSDLAPHSAPAPSPTEKSPAPAPGVASNVSHDADSGNIEASESPGGVNAGQKAGISIGVIACVFVVGLGVLVYKKRQQNIRRAQFGYAARRDIL